MSYTIVLNLESDDMDLVPEQSEVILCQEVATPKKNDVVVDVQGCGLSQVNETYRVDPTFMKKNERWNGKDTVFRMHCCEYWWWILAGSEAVYFNPNKRHDIPPKGGWSLARAGRLYVFS